jgi:hydroxymethylglutaryl-CoA reductase (NADPH)
VNKLAEIVAATVLAGELSLAAAISAHEWVSAHERLGRNR